MDYYDEILNDLERKMEADRRHQLEYAWNSYCEQEERIRAKAKSYRQCTPTADYQDEYQQKNNQQEEYDRYLARLDQWLCYKEGFEELIKDRGINRLIHFTRIGNLLSILKKGLLPRKELEKKNMDFEYNSQRNNDDSEANCLSISFPNYIYLSRLKNKNPNRVFVMLELSPEIILNKDCQFCVINAGSYRMKINRKQSYKEQLSYFKAMFSEKHNKNGRRRLNIPDNYPTNPEAEILVFNKIEPDYISKVAFKSQLDKKDFLRQISSRRDKRNLLLKIVKKYIELKVDSSLFTKRKDHQHW